MTQITDTLYVGHNGWATELIIRMNSEDLITIHMSHETLNKLRMALRTIRP